MRGEKKAYGGLVEIPKVKGHFEDLGVDGRIVLINKFTLWCALDLSNSGQGSLAGACE